MDRALGKVKLYLGRALSFHSLWAVWLVWSTSPEVIHYSAILRWAQVAPEAWCGTGRKARYRKLRGESFNLHQKTATFRAEVITGEWVPPSGIILPSTTPEYIDL